MYTLICIDCGIEFEHYNRRKVYCPECAERRDKENRKKAQQKHKSKGNQLKKYKKSLRMIVAELEAYNKEHNTQLSYGKYVAMIEKGGKFHL